MIMVNRAANCVTVYEKDAAGEFTVPVKAFVCSCGREGHETPLGTFKTSNYYEWRLMVDGSYGQYAVRFNRGIMFHSVPYYTKNAGNMEWEQFNLLGEPASLGCVRLACADAKWIYDNCKEGTKVVVYDDAENPGPLGKPEEMKLSEENPMRMWDPTDMSSKNPWNQVRPMLYLTGAQTSEVLMLPVGASLHDIYSAIGLVDASGRAYDIGEYIIDISGRYDLNQQGMYDVSVRGVGTHGVRTEKLMKLLVI
ncbi:MAG: L,D-transpeptidase [Lachnospiraceae bacterium]|nr:L,D-transpeptidase [Lachnospiraceae bacterium]MDE7029622.1 L,D-transpeptidase [Lachnospiraceae bacterium]